ncbi:MAG: hypothetical protein QOH49_2516 [Acidobacteriota bacterium]|jgi:hypothetical protein|nr:hypothetical protein [Acidobacteriota bacterium]
MKPKRSLAGSLTAGLACALLATAAPASRSATAQTPAATPAAQATVAPKHREAFAAFEARVKEYVALRERIEGQLPKLSKDSTPEQIEAHKMAFQDAVRAARASAKQGDLFVPALAQHIREVVKSELKPSTKQEVRQTVLEAEVKSVPLRVNYPYPDTEELIEMPPTLLLRLPQLPKQVRFRYVGRNMLLVDRENGLIVDFMTDALP